MRKIKSLIVGSLVLAVGTIIGYGFGANTINAAQPQFVAGAQALVQASEGARKRKKDLPLEAPDKKEQLATDKEQRGLCDVAVDADDALSRLKLLRIQMSIDREEIEALNLRIEKLEAQKKFAEAVAALEDTDTEDKGKGSKKKRPRRVKQSRNVSRNIADQIIIKAISLKPSKEAIILYKGKVFYVRKGDNLGDLEIVDIYEGGLKFKTARGSKGRVGVR